MAEKICGIYKITNTVNGKVYIGQSVNIYKRWERHKLLGTSCNISNPEHKYPLYMAMRKYGIDYFKFEIIDQCSRYGCARKPNSLDLGGNAAAR